jgi:hypothetical protein
MSISTNRYPWFAAELKTGQEDREAPLILVARMNSQWPEKAPSKESGPLKPGWPR